MSDFEAETGPKREQVADDIASLKQDVASLIKQMKEIAMREANRFSQDTADKITHRASDIYETVSDTGRKSADAITARVEQQPISSLLIAFAAGFVFSKILTR